MKKYTRPLHNSTTLALWVIENFQKLPQSPYTDCLKKLWYIYPMTNINNSIEGKVAPESDIK
jgi:hypothetical protein